MAFIQGELIVNNNDVLLPRTITEQVAINASKNLAQKLKEIDEEFPKYLPLTGGNLTGDLRIPTNDIILGNNQNLKLTQPNGVEINAIGMDALNTLFLGTQTTPMIIQGNPVRVYGNLLPQYDNVMFNWDIGHEQSRWTTVWAGSVNLTGMSNMGGLNTSSDILPHQHGQHWVGLDNQAFWGMRVVGGGFNQVSDETQKEDIRQVQDEEFFNMIKDVEVKSYLYKEPVNEASTSELIDEKGKEPRTQDMVEANDLNVGIIAQDMAKHEVSRFVLNHSDEGGYSINLYSYSASLHSALRHEIKKREALEERITKLEELIAQK